MSAAQYAIINAIENGSSHDLPLSTGLSEVILNAALKGLLPGKMHNGILLLSNQTLSINERFRLPTTTISGPLDITTTEDEVDTRPITADVGNTDLPRDGTEDGSLAIQARIVRVLKGPKDGMSLEQLAACLSSILPQELTRVLTLLEEKEYIQVDREESGMITRVSYLP